MRGYGHEPYFVEGDDPERMHQQMAATLDEVIDDIARIQAEAREQDGTPAAALADDRAAHARRAGPGPKEVDGLPVEGTCRAHQVPLAGFATTREHIAQLEAWMRSYRPEELFDADGAPVPRADGAGAQGRARA